MDVSLDTVAAKWPREEDKLTRFPESAEEENLQVCLRSRYITGHLEGFNAGGGGHVLLLGSGLCSYPYLIGEGSHWTEVDVAPMIAFKRARARELQEEGELPRREVTYLAADLDDPAQLSGALDAFFTGASGARTAAILEGLLYYVSAEAEDDLLASIAARQKSGDLLILDYWPTSAASHPIYQDWERELREESGNSDPVTRLTDPAKLLALPGYEVVDHYENGGFARRIGLGEFDPETHIPTEFVTLRRV